MKKLTFLLSAVALLGLASCTEPMEVNPNYNAETNEVTANFVFSVATGTTPQTKQSAANTQAAADAVFRGIDNAYVMPFTVGTAGNYVIADDATANRVFNMGEVMTRSFNGISATTNPNEKSHRILELALPVGSDAMMFYGKAIRTGMNDNEAGYVNYPSERDFNAALSGLQFSSKTRLTSETSQAFTEFQGFFAAVMNYLDQYNFHRDANALVWKVGDEIKGQNAAAIDIKWTDFVELKDGKMVVSTAAPLDATKPMCPLGEIIADAYISLSTIPTGETRAGSGMAIYYMLKDLDAIFTTVAGATPTSYQEYVAKNFAQEMAGRIEALINKDATGDGAYFKDVSVIDGITGYSTASHITSYRPSKFPTNLYIPMGAAQLKNTIGSYTKNGLSHPTATWSYDNSGDAQLYVYPTELIYYGNSPLRVSDKEMKESDYPDGVSNWNSWTKPQGSTWVAADWTTPGKVMSSTRSVAMKDNINYGVALLKTTVKYGTEDLKDNNKHIQQRDKGVTEEDKTVAKGKFALTGVLVGGQPLAVDWQFIPKTKDADNKYLVYDPLATATTLAESSTLENYTLLWDNYNAGTGQQDVYVALEFRNDGEAFWGNENLVRNGGTFYLLGQLKLANVADQNITWPTDHLIPPYASATTSTQTKRVFIQDFMTTVNITLGKDALKSAYVTVPNLRSSAISLGLSVDMKWETGLVFDLELGK